jgi:hypothetical protein
MCGVSFVDETRSGMTVVLVRSDCLFHRYSFAHEVGHVFGGAHQRESYIFTF